MPFGRLEIAPTLHRAQKAAAFILLKNCKNTSGRLDRIYKGESSSINGFLDDYAFLAEALIGLYEVTFEERWLEASKELTEYALSHFGDPQTRMFFYTSNEDDPLLTRSRETDDNVIPSSNSTMARVLYVLGTYFYLPEWTDRASSMLSRMQSSLVQEPGFFSNWARLSTLKVFPPYEVAILGPEAQQRRKELDRHFLPQAMFLGGATEGSLALLENKLVSGQTTIYVCTNKICKLPVREVAAALELMRE